MADIDKDGVDENTKQYCNTLIGFGALVCANVLAYLYDGDFLKIVFGCDLIIVGSYLKVNLNKVMAK